MVPDIETYNIILRNLMYQKNYNSTKDAFETIMNMVKLISKQGLVPNLRTFNSILYSISKIGRSKIVPNTALKILEEMKLLNIGKIKQINSRTKKTNYFSI